MIAHYAPSRGLLTLPRPLLLKSLIDQPNGVAALSVRRISCAALASKHPRRGLQFGVVRDAYRRAVDRMRQIEMPLGESTMATAAAERPDRGRYAIAPEPSFVVFLKFLRGRFLHVLFHPQSLRTGKPEAKSASTCSTPAKMLARSVRAVSG